MKFVFVILLGLHGFAKVEDSELTFFQKEVRACLPNLKRLKGLKSFDTVYSSISDQFLLTSEQNIYREVLFSIKDVPQKIKISKENLELFKIEGEGRLVSIPIDARQKLRTVSAQASQILNRAQISSDWHKTLEIREGSLTLEVVKKEGKIIQLSVEDRKTKQKLDCNSLNDSEVCICHKN
jgi:hypothetical protein